MSQKWVHDENIEQNVIETVGERRYIFSISNIDLSLYFKYFI